MQESAAIEAEWFDRTNLIDAPMIGMVKDSRGDWTIIRDHGIFGVRAATVGYGRDDVYRVQSSTGQFPNMAKCVEYLEQRETHYNDTVWNRHVEMGKVTA